MGEPFTSSPAGSSRSRQRTWTRTRSSRPATSRRPTRPASPTHSSTTGASRRTGRSRTRPSSWTGRRWPAGAILLAGDNFGAGSSREHAPWALAAWGIRAILSTSYADIFRTNGLKNGVLPIVVDPATHRRLFELVEADPDARLTVDLAEQGLLLPDGSTIEFEIDPFARRMLLAGTDEIGYVLAKLPEIEAWEAAHAGRVDTRLGTPLEVG